MQPVFKVIGRGDTHLLDNIADEVFDEPIDPKRLRAYLAEPGHMMIVAVRDGQVVGQVMAVIHRHPDKPTELYIDEVGVAPAFQRRQIATRLLDNMLALGRQRGCEEMWVGTEPDNEAAKALYRNLGLDERDAVVFEGEL